MARQRYTRAAVRQRRPNVVVELFVCTVALILLILLGMALFR